MDCGSTRSGFASELGTQGEAAFTPPNGWLDLLLHKLWRANGRPRLTPRHGLRPKHRALLSSPRRAADRLGGSWSPAHSPYCRTPFEFWIRIASAQLIVLLLSWGASVVHARDLPEILEAGVLRHLGVPYANFVTGIGDGMDVELMQGFARHLGVRYAFAQTTWEQAIGDLTGRNARRAGSRAEPLDPTPVRGDVIANGMTVLSWREDVLAFSDPTFPSGVWLVARADSPLVPIVPSGILIEDIREVKRRMAGHAVLALENTCLDPGLYDLETTGVEVRLQPSDRSLNEMVPAILNQAAEATLLDVPDALVALERWPGQVKVIGPISERQVMAAAFRKSSPGLRQAFNQYLAKIRADGSYHELVQKYYPAVFHYFGEFFRDAR